MFGNYSLFGEFNGCEFQRETRYFKEKFVEITLEWREVEGSEVGESFEEAMKKRVCGIRKGCDGIDSERGSETVGEGEKVFRDEGERF
jgi:hypothetical protein